MRRERLLHADRPAGQRDGHLHRRRHTRFQGHLRPLGPADRRAEHHQIPPRLLRSRDAAGLRAHQHERTPLRSRDGPLPRARQLRAGPHELAELQQILLLSEQPTEIHGSPVPQIIPVGKNALIINEFIPFVKTHPPYNGNYRATIIWY